MTLQLSSEDYGRMICCTVSCPSCCANRGEACRRKNGGVGAISNMHTDRRVTFWYWKKRYPLKYKKLRGQCEEQLRAYLEAQQRKDNA